MIVLVGSNLCIAHPILWERICRTRTDPRSSSSIRAAPRRRWRRRCTSRCGPKSDLTLLLRGRSASHFDASWIDRDFIDAHTNGFDEFARTSRRSRPSGGRGDRARGRRHRAIRAASSAAASACSFWWTMGVNQSHEGVRVAQAIINLALLTGNIGRPGTGANSITGQCNAMGSRLFSNTTNLLGGRDFKNAEHRDEVARMLGIAGRAHSRANRASPTTRSSRGSIAAKIRGLWVIATNTAHSWINQADAIDVLETARLPGRPGHVHDDRDRGARAPRAAGRGLGREGGHVHQLRAAHRPREEGVRARPARRSPTSTIFKLLAEAWGVGELFRRWTDPEAMFQTPEGALARPALRHHRHHRLRDARRVGAASSGRCARASACCRRASGACSRTDASSTPTAGALRASSRRARRPRRPTRSIPFVLLTGRGLVEPVAHPDAHREIGRAAPSLPERALRRDEPDRRGEARHFAGRVGHRRVAARKAQGTRAIPPTSSGPGKSSCRCTTRRRTGSPSRRSIRTRASRPTSTARCAFDSSRRRIPDVARERNARDVSPCFRSDPIVFRQRCVDVGRVSETSRERKIPRIERDSRL